jgi:hypothetical protein
MLEGGGDFDVLLLQKFKCWLTELKCYTEDLAVQVDYYCQGRRNGCKSGEGHTLHPLKAGDGR